MNKEIKLIDLGLLDYKKAWDFQEKLFQEIIEKSQLDFKAVIFELSKEKSIQRLLKRAQDEGLVNRNFTLQAPENLKAGGYVYKD